MKQVLNRAVDGIDVLPVNAAFLPSAINDASRSARAELSRTLVTNPCAVSKWVSVPRGSLLIVSVVKP